MSVRTLNWFESAFDATIISKNGLSLQVAQAVASGSSTAAYSMVWKSRDLSPMSSISWKAEYALAWTANVPNQGVAVRIRSEWQPCNKGESFDIDQLGYWQPSKKLVEASSASWLNVGNIEYADSSVLGVHIVVGVRNADTNRFEAVFIDQTPLGPGSSARYQPQETISWWLEGSDLTGQVISTQRNRSATQDFTNPSPQTGAFEWSTSFMVASSQWVITPGAAPQSINKLPAPAQSAAVSPEGNAPSVAQLGGGTSWMVKFAVPLVPAALNRAAAGLYNILKDKFPLQEVQVERSGGSMLRVTLDAASGAVIAIGEALGQILSRGDLPMNETWQIFPLDQSGQLQD
ncbi:hypothetical protein F5X68DRAFT_189819 [Plectosphaerella plurivora]|uniref:Uncharacterized protein n=1 Tax=Plectosphaerella plurivora TaxID=936078 RepID=A0A9P8VEB2_9PEZI|nr:hypothetical protein F5X68DRAFT_189819 [Plectosphaerella plurivora]